jgi:hypothetical protein
VVGALNTIAGGPNTSARIDQELENGGHIDAALTRGPGRDVRASGTLDLPFLPRPITVGADGTLDPPTGRAEISASGVKGRSIQLPPRIRVYTTPTGELDVDLPGAIRIGGIPISRGGTYVIGQRDRPKRRK